MGAPMARNLLKAGFQVRVWNRTPDKARVLATEGADLADNVSGRWLTGWRFETPAERSARPRS
jgi:6-phosphogluconate dehydrogenase